MKHPQGPARAVQTPLTPDAGGARRWLIGLLAPLVFGLLVTLLGWGNATSQRLAALEVKGQVSKEQFDRMEAEVRETRRSIDRLLDHFSLKGKQP